jgi:pilus assembly protein TadC
MAGRHGGGPVNVGSTSGQVLAAVLLAAAVMVLPPRSAAARSRLGLAAPVNQPKAGRPATVLPALCGLAVGSLVAVLAGATGLIAGAVLGVLAALAARRCIREPTGSPTDPLRVAGVWDLLTACLRTGLPVATATAAIADQLPGPDGTVLRAVAGLLASGADPAQAWEQALGHPSTTALARAARRTAHSGAAMATAVAELAVQVRADAADLVEERAQRASVLITGPLGLCFLPAFFCLGVLPVVIGLAEQLIPNW